MNEHTAAKAIDVEAADRVAEPAAEVRADLRAAREMIPVGPRGATLMNFAQQIDYAQSMAKAMFSIPEFLRGNVGDCLAIIDIASRADLSPYMLAMKTYLEPKSKKLCFESQAYHALAMPWLKGDFEISYKGEGEDTICIIAGYLKSDPTKRREHISEPLAKARPKRNDEGVTKGSPLWDKKPRVQLAYDTMRDWVRLYAPRATLGIYTPDEIEQYAIRDVTPLAAAQGAATRNRALPRGPEGHQGQDHIEAELAQIAPGGAASVIKPAADDKQAVSRETPPQAASEVAAAGHEVAKGAAGDQPSAERGGQVIEATANQPDAQATTEANSDGKQKKPKPDAAKTPAQDVPKVEPAKSVEKEAEKAKKEPKEAENPKEYEELWLALIEAAASPKIKDDWKRERAVRERLGVPAEMIDRLRAKIETKVGGMMMPGV